MCPPLFLEPVDPTKIEKRARDVGPDRARRHRHDARHGRARHGTATPTRRATMSPARPARRRSRARTAMILTGTSRRSPRFSRPPALNLSCLSSSMKPSPERAMRARRPIRPHDRRKGDRARGAASGRAAGARRSGLPAARALGLRSGDGGDAMKLDRLFAGAPAIEVDRHHGGQPQGEARLSVRCAEGRGDGRSQLSSMRRSRPARLRS